MCIRVSPTGLDAQRSMAAEKEAIEEFAQANGIEIVGEYIDEDDGRLASPALKRLVADARFPECNFRTVLVYEMSRSSPGAYAPIQLQMSFVPHPVTTAVTNPFPYQLFEIRLCCNRSIKPLYGLSRAVVRLVAHGGPKSEFSSRLRELVARRGLQAPFSRLRSPVGAAPPSLLGERLLWQVDFLPAHARQRAVSRQREGVADDCHLGVDLYLGDDCAQEVPAFLGPVRR